MTDAPSPADAVAPPAPERFLAQAVELGLELEVSSFPAGTRTAPEAARAVGCDVGAIVKSLVFIADERPVLALVSGSRRVDETALATALGAEVVRRATPDEARAATGYAIGGTPPFGLTGGGVDVTVCDPALLQHDIVWAAAGSPEHVFPLAPVQLLAASGARIVDIAP